MSDIFSLMYGEIFLKDNNDNPLDKERIELITKKYIESKVRIEKKKEFLRLKREYFRIMNIIDYENVQKKLYNGKNKKEIIAFELFRIKNASKDDELMEQVSMVESLIDSYDIDVPDDLYMKIIYVIIKLELSYGIKIGLFREFCSLFENECKKIESDNLTNKDKFINHR